MNWVAQHFLHPSFVLPVGAALVGLPVLIHLINRLRYKRMKFAAMNFLLQSQQRNRRRLLIEQLILLATRMAIVAAILALIARLVLDPSSLWVFRGAKSHHLVLLDDSGSMRDRWAETTAFKEALTLVRRLAADGVRRPGTQQLTILTLSQPERPLVMKRDVNNAFAGELETILERLVCTHQPVDPVAGLEAAAKLFAEDGANVRHLHYISDFRAADWNERTALRDAFAAVANSGASINLVRAVGERHENLAITSLTSDVGSAAAGIPVRFHATVKNFGTKVVQDVRLAAISDGTPLPMSAVIDRLEAGEERVRELDVTFKTPGKHTLEVRLPNDALPQDGRRFAALNIELVNPVLIIDGNPENDDGSFIATALAADSSITGYSTTVEGVDFLRREPLAKFRCIYLLNVPQLPADTIGILAEYVRTGGGIAWFMGDVVNAAHYNDALYAKGNGIFPIRLASAAKDLPHADDATLAPDLEFSQHPLFRVFEGQDNPFIDKVRINTWLPAAPDWTRDDNRRKDDVRTIAFLPGREPLVVERQVGAGKVLAVLTTAGPAWNNWGQNPSVVVFHLELAKYLSRNDQPVERRIVGEPIRIDFDPAEFLETVEISAPDRAGPRVSRLKATRPSQPSNAADSKIIRVATSFSETDEPGMYAVRLFKDQAGAPQERWVAFNVPSSESDLKTATTSEILSRLSANVPVHIHEANAFEVMEGQGAGHEARTLLLALLAALLIFEQWFAYRLSYHHGEVAHHHIVREAA